MVVNVSLFGFHGLLCRLPLMKTCSQKLDDDICLNTRESLKFVGLYKTIYPNSNFTHGCKATICIMAKRINNVTGVFEFIYNLSCGLPKVNSSLVHAIPFSPCINKIVDFQRRKKHCDEILGDKYGFVLPIFKKHN